MAKKSPGRRPSGQGHLQASRDAPSGSFSAAPRHRAPVIWRRWEPCHPRVCPSPSGAPALARGRGRARGGLASGRGTPRRRWAGAQGVLCLSPAMLADTILRWRLFLSAPPRLGAPSAGRGGRGAERAVRASCRASAARSQPSSSRPSPAEARNPLAARAQPSAPPLRASATFSARPTPPGSPPPSSPQLLPLQPQ